MHHIDYGLGVFEREVFGALLWRAARSVGGLSGPARRGASGGVRDARAFYEIGSRRVCETPRNFSRRAREVLFDLLPGRSGSDASAPTRSHRTAAALLAGVRDRGRLFIIGVGGSAANASHAVNDFASSSASRRTRRPTMAELTARINTKAGARCFEPGGRWPPAGSGRDSGVLGGRRERRSRTSAPTSSRHSTTRNQSERHDRIVGRDGGYTAERSAMCGHHSHRPSRTASPRTRKHFRRGLAPLVSIPRSSGTPRAGSLAPSQLRPAVFLDRDGVLNDALVREGNPMRRLGSKTSE